MKKCLLLKEKKGLTGQQCKSSLTNQSTAAVGDLTKQSFIFSWHLFIEYLLYIQEAAGTQQ
jgi:hypothetical protein